MWEGVSSLPRYVQLGASMKFTGSHLDHGTKPKILGIGTPRDTE